MRYLIPSEHHLYAVCGIIITCTTFTITLVNLLSKRIRQRHFNGPAHLDKDSLARLDGLDLGVGIAIYALAIIAVATATIVTLGVVNFIVAASGYIALMALITVACQHYKHHKHISDALYDHKAKK